MSGEAKVWCSASVFSGYRAKGCANRGKIERDGKWYCGTHDPVRAREKEAAKQAERDARNDAMRLRMAVREAEANLVNAVMEYDDPGSYPLEVHDAYMRVKRARERVELPSAVPSHD